jgi:hypothetical protein
VTTQAEAVKRGLKVGENILEAIADYQTNAPRTQQSTARILGMSEMAGCREYIRATIAGDPKKYNDPLKWAAFVGTAVGEQVEMILEGYGYQTQQDVQVVLPRTGITVKGHLDARRPGVTIDLKTRDGLAEVRREGPPFKEKAQISGYLVGDVQAGVHDKDAVGVLVYLDRSGKTPETFTWSVTYEQALEILDAVEDRLIEVQHALAGGVSQGYLRDEPESYCYAIGCPFYNACWDGYTPTDKIEHPREIEAVTKFVEARDQQKDAGERREQYREDLRGVEGVTPDGTIVRWTVSHTESGGLTERLDVRVPK